MRAYRSSPLLIIPAVLMLSGCWGTVRGSWRVDATYSVPTEVVVSAPPPPLRAEVEVRPAAPHAQAVWVDGHWKWEGRWVWEPGRWERPRAGYVWVAPVARRQGGRIVYYAGYWAPARRPPPPAYRADADVIVVAHPPRVVVRPAEPQGRVVVRPAEPQPEPQPRVIVRPPREPEPQARVVVRPPQPEPRPEPEQPRVVVRVPEPQGRVEVRPPQGRVVVRPGREPEPQPEPQPRVIVRPAPEVNRADPRPARAVEAPQGPGTVRAEGEGRAAVMPRPRTEQRDITPRTDREAPQDPREVRPQPGGMVQRDQTARTEVERPEQSPNLRQAPGTPIACRTDTPRAPEGGLVGITGSGFGTSASVRIGGRIAQIVERGQGRFVVRVPGSAGGGNVTIVDGDRTGNCGTLSVSSR